MHCEFQTQEVYRWSDVISIDTERGPRSPTRRRNLAPGSHAHFSVSTFFRSSHQAPYYNTLHYLAFVYTNPEMMIHLGVEATMLFIHHPFSVVTRASHPQPLYTVLQGRSIRRGTCAVGSILIFGQPKWVVVSRPAQFPVFLIKATQHK